MRSKKKRLRGSRLYLILDKKTLGATALTTAASKLKNSGIDIIQLRDKSAKKIEVLKESMLLKRILDKTGVLFIINDHPEVAAICGADGVHLGQCDLPVKSARRILGKDKIVGVSCHSLKDALRAQKDGADYIGIGPVFSTPTKPEYRPIGLKELEKLRGKIHIPYFAIGNINKSNLSEIKALGVRRFALCRAILKVPNPARAAKELNVLIDK